MKKRPARDPGAPKRSVPAYLLYQNAMREQFMALYPEMTFGQLAKYTSAMYSELPPSEKEAWTARTLDDKARYLYELASYIPPPGYDPKGDAIVFPVNTKSGRKGKPEKDINAPKRNTNAYLLYQNSTREQLKRENPGITFGQVAKYTSHMYKNHTSEEKATWEARAAQDKARYDTEIATYVPPLGYDARGVLIEDHRPRKPPKDPSAPKRASSAYLFFTNEMRPKVLQEYPGITFVELGKVLGERWWAITAAEKNRYEHMAVEDKMRFQLQMQQYAANKAAAAPPQPTSTDDYYQGDPSAAAHPYDAYAQHDYYGQHAQYHAA
jgi:high mobility group protein B2